MIFLILLAASNLLATETLHYTQEDSLKFVSIVSKITATPVHDSDIGLLAAKIAKEFVGTPYVASTLEKEGEPLTIKLTGVDCTTLIEYTLGMLICIMNKRMDFSYFCEAITKIRYRNGLRDGYKTRLHYFTEWLTNNRDRGLLVLITDSIGNRSMDKEINFMSKNKKLYKQLEDSSVLADIIATEKTVSVSGLKYLEKGKAYNNRQGRISTGDIVAFVSRVDGLDVSHAVMAVRKKDKLYFLHASSKSGRVELSRVTLGEYLQKSNKLSGVVIGRINMDGLR